MNYDRKTHGDFKSWFDKDLKRNYWTLGYFGGGAINVVETMALAKEFAEVIGVPLETVYIDEILSSRRFKGFKFISSNHPDQEPDKEGSYQTTGVYGFLRD